MVSVLRRYGLDVVIYLDDHPPAHVHVLGEGELKIQLVGADGSPELIWAYGMKKNDIRRAVRVIEEYQEFLLSRWKKIHG